MLRPGRGPGSVGLAGVDALLAPMKASGAAAAVAVRDTAAPHPPGLRPLAYMQRVNSVCCCCVCAADPDEGPEGSGSTTSFRRGSPYLCAST
jgi:hypothetical protein